MKKKKREGLCFIYMTDAELSVYDRDHCESLADALEVFHKDALGIARHEGYREEQIFLPGILAIERRIEAIWA